MGKPDSQVVCNAVTQVYLATVPRSFKAMREQLSLPAFIALHTLHECGTLTPGELKRALDLKPAQMSRILRTLEDPKYVTCLINEADKRKVDVTLTTAGRRALEAYRGMLVEKLGHLFNGKGEG